MSTTPSIGTGRGHSSSSPPTVMRGPEHLGPPSILQQIESMIGTLEGDSCPSTPVDRPDNLSEWWLYVIQESLLRLRARGRVGPPRASTPSPLLLFSQSTQVPMQDMSQMSRNPGMEVEAAPRPSLVTPSHSPAQHEPSPPLEFHLRQTTPTDVPNSVSTTTTDTITATLFSTEIVPSQLSSNAPGASYGGEAGQKWSQNVAFEGAQSPQAPMPPPGQIFPSQPKQPVLAAQPSALDSDVILKLLRDNREEQQTILDQQRKILACLRSQQDVHKSHAHALARLERTLHKEVIPLMKQVAQYFASDFPPTSSNIDSLVSQRNSPYDDPPIRALNAFAPGQSPEPSSSYGQFPVGGGPVINSSPTLEYFPEPSAIRRIRVEYRSQSPEPASLPPSPPEPDAVSWNMAFEEGSDGGLVPVGSSDNQDAEETEEQTHYGGSSSLGIDSRSRQQSPVAQEAYRHMEVTRSMGLDSDLENDPTTERILPFEGFAWAGMFEASPGRPTWTGGVESIVNSEEPGPQEPVPAWRVQPREQDRIIALENELVAIRQQLDCDRTLCMMRLERQRNSNVPGHVSRPGL